MIITNSPRVPWSWVWLSQLPFAFWMFATQINQSVFQLSMNKFAASPAVISLTLSIAALPLLVISPLVSFSSDHIWTRFGRRKPFYIAANSFSGLFILLMGFAQNFWQLAGCFWLHYIASAFGKTFFPLSQEVIPIPQRGRASAIHQIMFQSALLVFFLLALGRFNDVTVSGPLSLLGPLSGERLIYLLCGLGMLLPVLIIGLGLRELPHAEITTSSVPLRDLTGFFRTFVRETFTRQFSALYLLLLSTALYPCLVPLQALLFTEQWGYSTQEMGLNIGVGALISLPFVIWAGHRSDRGSKMKIYLVSLSCTMALTLSYYVTVHWGVPNQHPKLWLVLLFGQLIAIPRIITDTVQWPLIYEYIPRARMGTAAGGLEMMGGIFGILLVPLSGLWVEAHSRAFLPPAGPEARICLVEPANRRELQAWLTHGDIPVHVALSAWDLPGEGDRHRVWTVREITADGDRLKAQHEEGTLEMRGAAQAEIEARQQRFLDGLRKKLGDRLLPESRTFADFTDRVEVCAAMESTPFPSLRDEAWAKSYLAEHAHEGDAAIDPTHPRNLLVTLPPTCKGAAAGILDGTPEPAPLPFHAYNLTVWPHIDDAMLRRLRAEVSSLDEGLVLVSRASAETLHLRAWRVKAPQLAHSDPSSTPAQQLEAPSDAAESAWRAAVFRTLVTAVAKEGGIVPQSIQNAHFARREYDYFSGYLFQGCATAVAIALALIVVQLERRGIVRKLGVEEVSRSS